MFTRLTKYWTSLKRGRPGSRFQEQYEREHRKQKRPVGRVLRIAGGLILMPIGLFFLAVPGPGLLIIGLGAVLIAREFGFAAKALDSLEVRARTGLKGAQRRWRRLTEARRKVVRR